MKMGEQEKLPQNSDTYDKLFQNSEVYARPFRESPYYPMFVAALSELGRHNATRVLEVGCGPGHLGQMILEQSTIKYHGFDFSPVAIKKAIDNYGRPDLFYVADATDPTSYKPDYDCLVCTEVLEHIEDDIGVVRCWEKGSLCVCSVPNFDSKYHVRFFASENEVRRRYGGLIKIKSIKRVKVRQTAGMTTSQRFRAIAKNFYRPHRLTRLAELAPFSWGGWFVFSGVRRDE